MLLLLKLLGVQLRFLHVHNTFHSGSSLQRLGCNMTARRHQRVKATKLLRCRIDCLASVLICRAPVGLPGRRARRVFLFALRTISKDVATLITKQKDQRWIPDVRPKERFWGWRNGIGLAQSKRRSTQDHTHSHSPPSTNKQNRPLTLVYLTLFSTLPPTHTAHHLCQAIPLSAAGTPLWLMPTGPTMPGVAVPQALFPSPYEPPSPDNHNTLSLSAPYT